MLAELGVAQDLVRVLQPLLVLLFLVEFLPARTAQRRGRRAKTRDASQRRRGSRLEASGLDYPGLGWVGAVLRTTTFLKSEFSFGARSAAPPPAAAAAIRAAAARVRGGLGDGGAAECFSRCQENQPGESATIFFCTRANLAGGSPAAPSAGWRPSQATARNGRRQRCTFCRKLYVRFALRRSCEFDELLSA